MIKWISTKIKDDFSVSDICRYDETQYKIHTYRRSNQPAREDSQAISLSTLSNCPEQNLFTILGEKIVQVLRESGLMEICIMYAVLGLGNELFLP